jgi:16S rRNA (guanine966-N2)-methyltransferase
MRIYGNRVIKTLPSPLTRPTTAKVREALFNIWQGRIAGCRWLDLCAGNGAMGAEALCRGAKFAIGIEQNGRACGVIQQNWQMVAQDAQSFQVLRGDVLKVLSKLAGEGFDLIYFDPPYASGLYQPVLEAIAHLQLLHPTGEIAVEHDPHHWQAGVVIAGLSLIRQRHYGNTTLSFYESR